MPAKKKEAVAEVKKPTARKSTKKAAAPAEAPKKGAAPAEAPKKEVKPKVEKKTLQDYKDVINWKKWEAHNMNWLYIEVNAGALNEEVENGVNNIKVAAQAVLDLMLEGDGFIVEPKVKSRISKELTVRYYTDNLREDRRSYWEVNQ